MNEGNGTISSDLLDVYLKYGSNESEKKDLLFPGLILLVTLPV